MAKKWAKIMGIKLVRKFKPRKKLEVGVAEGGSSIIILYANQNIKNSHLYSIDISPHEKIGFCVKNIFPELLKRWSLFKGNVAAKFIEEIGGGIDMVFIDSSHYEAGEILDFLIILPFLKKEQYSLSMI
jgi:predicted O-methyltransferase YrrM